MGYLNKLLPRYKEPVLLFNHPAAYLIEFPCDELSQTRLYSTSESLLFGLQTPSRPIYQTSADIKFSNNPLRYESDCFVIRFFDVKIFTSNQYDFPGDRSLESKM